MLAALCGELSHLKYEAETKLFNALLLYGEGGKFLKMSFLAAPVFYLTRYIENLVEYIIYL